MIRSFLKAGTLLSIVCIIIIGAGCSRSKQKMEVPDIKMITKENVHGVIAPDDDNIWIVGNYGTIYHSSDGGESWIKQDSGIKEFILCDGVFLDSKTGWIVGAYGTILHTTDKGETWIKQDPGTDKHLFGISFVDESHGWVVGEWNIILHTTDGGKTWETQTEEEDKILNNVLFIDRENGWLVGEAGIIRNTNDGGKTWSIKMPKSFERETLDDLYARQRPALFGIHFTDKNNGILCGIEGAILKTTDSGTTWDVIESHTTLTLYTVFMKNGKGWIVGDKGAYLISSDGGSTWEATDDVIKSKFWFRDVYFPSPENGWAVGQGGSVVHTTDGGKTWKFRSGISYAMEFFKMPKALEFGGGVE